MVRLSATVSQLRVDEGTRRIAAQVTNRGSTAVTVRSVALESARTEPLPATPKDTVFQPGQTIDLAIEYGDPICDRGATSADTRFRLGLADGSTVEVPVDALGRATLDRFVDRDCALKRIASIASIRYGAVFRRDTVDGERFLRGVLVLTRPPSATADDRARALEIDSVEGSVLVRFEPYAGSIPVTMPPRLPRLRVPVLIGSFRCDQHARAGSTQTFLLSIYVREPGEPQQRVIDVPDKALQRQILALIDDNCR